MASDRRNSRNSQKVVNGEQSSSERAANTILTLDEDPYKHLTDLGDGAYGIVDKVERDGRVYARKKIRFSRTQGREVILRAAQNEFAVLRRLKHRHIIEVVEVFQCKNRIRMIMAQVADTDLQEYLERVDAVSIGSERDSLRKPMQMWPGCLIQAIDYLHEMRVKHRDLKPANILIIGDQVLIADFGVSKDLIDEQTTKSLTGAERGGTPMYWAPEMAFEGPHGTAKRGRAVDIFALGCIFLEIATVFMALPGSRAQFADFREINGFRVYRACPGKLLQWIWYLWGHWSQYTGKVDKMKAAEDEFLEHGPAVSDLAFLMLDPNPKTRITARQLVALLSEVTNHLYYWTSVKETSCDKCKAGNYVGISNIPLHSVYKGTDDLTYPKHPSEALVLQFPPDWEAAKREWLQHHMWW